MKFNLKRAIFGSTKYGTGNQFRILYKLHKKRLLIIKILLDGEPYQYTLSKLSRKAGLAKSTVWNLLRPLILNNIIKLKLKRFLSVNPLYNKQLKDIIADLDTLSNNKHSVLGIHHYCAYSFPCEEDYKIFYKVAKYLDITKKDKTVYQVFVPGTSNSLVVEPGLKKVKVYLDFPVLIRNTDRDKLDTLIQFRADQELKVVLTWVESEYALLLDHQLASPFAFEDYMHISFLGNRIAYYLYVKLTNEEFREYRGENVDLNKSKGHIEIEFKGSVKDATNKAKRFLRFLEIIDKMNFSEEDVVEFACYLANKLVTSLNNKRRGGV